MPNDTASVISEQEETLIAVELQRLMIYLESLHHILIRRDETPSATAAYLFARGDFPNIPLIHKNWIRAWAVFHSSDFTVDDAKYTLLLQHTYCLMRLVILEYHEHNYSSQLL